MVHLSVGVLLLPLVCSHPRGWLSSPDHPLAYPSNSSKNWTVCASPGFAVSLTLIHLDLENSTDCKHDALKVSYCVCDIKMEMLLLSYIIICFFCQKYSYFHLNLFIT